MKCIFSLLLIFISLEAVFSSKFVLNRMAKAMLTMKNIKEYKDEKRKLEESSDKESNEDSDYPSDYTNGTAANTTESPPFEVDPEESVATEPKTTTDTNSKLQIKKFHNFERQPAKVVFRVFVYFLNRLIARVIKFRVRIVYYGGLRNLEDQVTAESSPTTCELLEQYSDKVGELGTGENIDYNCSAPAKASLNITNVTLDTDYNMLADNESINFTEVNFAFDSANESVNIHEAPNYDKSGSLDDTSVELPVQRNYFRLKGTLNPEDLLSQGDVIPMIFVEFSNTGEQIKKKINCTAIEVNKPACTLECDTTKTPINTNAANLSLSESTDSNVYMTINVNEVQKAALTPIVTPYSGRNVYWKSSSGLSGGAIAAIVIACVVAIIAASILAIMFRRPKPAPVDNTTVVGLNTAENL